MTNRRSVSGKNEMNTVSINITCHSEGKPTQRVAARQLGLLRVFGLKEVADVVEQLDVALLWLL